MRAGKLDRIIRIERAGTIYDEARTPVETWTVLASARAELASREVSEAPREPGAATEDRITFRIRFLSGLTTADRVLFEGRHHDIRGIRELGRRRGLELECSTRAAA